jgi:uncharacterized Ntn-hydrolase superfamily protein
MQSSNVSSDTPGRLFSTFSVTGYDPSTGDLGAAVASKFPAVGAACLAGIGGVGIVTNQSWWNAEFNRRSLMLLESGFSSEDVIQELLKNDPKREFRQISIIDSEGVVCTHSGKYCQEWAGFKLGRNCSAQGNVLEGPKVIEAMVEGFEKTEGDLIDKLMKAIALGDNAGGDLRGKQSAAILVVRKNGGFRGEGDRLIDLRVDDHPNPILELDKLVEVYDSQILHRLGSRELELMQGLDVQELQVMLRALGFFNREPDGWFERDTHEAVKAFERAFNLMEWGHVSFATLRQIRKAYAGLATIKEQKAPEDCSFP